MSLSHICVVVLCTIGKNCFFALLLEVVCIITVVFGTGSMVCERQEFFSLVCIAVYRFETFFYNF